MLREWWYVYRYRRYRRRHRDPIDMSWRVAPADIGNFFRLVDLRLLQRLTADDYRYLNNFKGGFHHRNIMDLVANGTALIRQLRDGGYVESALLRDDYAPYILRDWLHPEGGYKDTVTWFISVNRVYQDIQNLITTSDDEHRRTYLQRKLVYFFKDCSSVAELINEVLANSIAPSKD